MIEKTVTVPSIKTDFKYVSCNFMNVITFGFLVDISVEAGNSGMKSGSVKVSTNMTINVSSSA